MRCRYKYFVYMLNSSSRRALYTGVTNALVMRVNEHRTGDNSHRFTAQYRAFRLVYYEEFGDVRAAIAREKQIKGWTRAKKNALVTSMNPKWRDLISEWEPKYGVRFELHGVSSHSRRNAACDLALDNSHTLSSLAVPFGEGPCV